MTNKPVTVIKSTRIAQLTMMDGSTKPACDGSTYEDSTGSLWVCLTDRKGNGGMWDMNPAHDAVDYVIVECFAPAVHARGYSN